MLYWVAMIPGPVTLILGLVMWATMTANDVFN